jgi:hypothetical protein
MNRKWPKGIGLGHWGVRQPGTVAHEASYVISPPRQTADGPGNPTMPTTARELMLVRGCELSYCFPFSNRKLKVKIKAAYRRCEESNGLKLGPILEERRRLSVS